MTEINDSKHSHTFEAFQAEESEIFLSRILKLTKARAIYVMISVTLVQMTLNIILQRRATLLKQRQEVLLRILVTVQFGKYHKARVLVNNTTIDLT